MGGVDKGRPTHSQHALNFVAEIQKRLGLEPAVWEIQDVDCLHPHELCCPHGVPDGRCGVFIFRLARNIRRSDRLGQLRDATNSGGPASEDQYEYPIPQLRVRRYRPPASETFVVGVGTKDQDGSASHGFFSTFIQ